MNESIHERDLKEKYQQYLKEKSLLLVNKLGIYCDNINDIIFSENNFINYRNNSTLSFFEKAHNNSQDKVSQNHNLSSDSNFFCSVTSLLLRDYLNKWIKTNSSLSNVFWKNIKIRETPDKNILIKLELSITSSNDLDIWHDEKDIIVRECMLLRDSHSVNIKSIYYSIDGGKDIKIYGDDYLTFTYATTDQSNEVASASKILTIHPNNFTQINYSTFSHIYETIKFYLSQISYKNIVSFGDDSGNLCVILSDICEKTIGFTHSYSYESSRINIYLNNLTNFKLEDNKNWCGLLKYNDDDNVLIINPGRKGLCKDGVKVINRMTKIKHIIYMSCKISTLAKDLSNINTFTISSITPIDNFPFVDDYLENIVMLSR